MTAPMSKVLWQGQQLRCKRYANLNDDNQKATEGVLRPTVRTEACPNNRNYLAKRRLPVRLRVARRPLAGQYHAPRGDTEHE